MRRFFLVLLTMVVCFAANAQNTSKVNAHSFSLNASLSFDNYGWLSDANKATSTEYAGLRITPDWRFAKHWGVKMDLGAAWAFTSNAAGKWGKPMHSICNVGLALAPYYEFNIKNWFIDLGALASCRLRLPYMNGEASKYLLTLSMAVGVDFRFGYMFANNWSIFADLYAARTVYDLLYRAYYASPAATSGCIAASVGVAYKIHAY